MEIKASCIYDFESVKALNSLILFKKANPSKRMAFWSIAFMILMAIIIFEIIVFDADTVLLILLAINIIWCLLGAYLYFILPKIRYRAMAKMREVENEYIFTDETLKVVTKSDEYNGEADIEYSLFVRVYETSKYLFLYQTNNQVFVVDKSTIVGGTIEEIRNKLFSYLNNKYVICNY